MNYQLKFLLFIVCALLNQYLVEATIFACNHEAPCGCSVNDANISARIVGGEPSANHSWGWAVSLRNASGGHFCGGSIVSAHYILTAAHCFDNPYITNFRMIAAVGTDTLSDNEGQRLTVSKCYKHPGYNNETYENDIALAKLDKAISFKDMNVAKLCLPSLTDYKDVDFPWINTKLVAIGWGFTAQGGSDSNVLKQVTIAAVGPKKPKCSNVIRNATIQFCAAVDGGGKDTCQDDSGGPLMYYSYKFQQWMIAGITSYSAPQCGSADFAGVYTRASMYISWIKSVVGKDGVVIAGENAANVSTMSNIFSIVILSILTLFRSF